MPKILFVVAQEGFRDEELFVPKQILEDEGNEVVVASLSTEMAKGSKGGSVKPDVSVKEAKEYDFDVLVMVGGPGAVSLCDVQEIEDLFCGSVEEGKTTGAICIAPMNLAKWGLLTGRKATVFKTDESMKAFEENGVEYTGKDVEVDENIITANGPAAAEAFARKILEMLTVEEV